MSGVEKKTSPEPGEAPRTMALIPARGGSRRLPGKNLRLFAGQPLIVWTIRAALESEVFQRVVVSSDDERILEVSCRAGAEGLLRPPDLAADESSSMDVVRHAFGLEGSALDVLMLLQPTSPLRGASDIREGWRLMRDRSAASMVSVTDRSKHPEWSYELDPDLRLLPQGTTPGGRLVGLNGAIYAARVSWLALQSQFVGEGTLGFWMPEERSADIDTLEEFEAAERQFNLP